MKSAIPELLDMLILDGNMVTIDAMGCQRDICQKVLEKDAHCTVGLKGNQGNLHEDVTLYFQEQYAKDFMDCDVTHIETIEKDHGRIEERNYYIISDIEWLKTHKWPGLESINRSGRVKFSYASIL